MFSARNALSDARSGCGSGSCCSGIGVRFIEKAVLLEREQAREVMDEHQLGTGFRDAVEKIDAGRDRRACLYLLRCVMEHPVDRIDDQRHTALWRSRDDEMVAERRPARGQPEARPYVHDGDHFSMHVNRPENHSRRSGQRRDLDDAHHTLDRVELKTVTQRVERENDDLIRTSHGSESLLQSARLAFSTCPSEGTTHEKSAISL